MGTLKFTEDVTLEMLTHTDTGVPNDIDIYLVSALSNLTRQVITPIITHFGKSHIEITSAYRSYMVNQMVGGVSNSKHLEGKACDIVFVGVDFDTACKWIKENIKFGYLKTYPDNRIHIQI